MCTNSKVRFIICDPFSITRLLWVSRYYFFVILVAYFSLYAFHNNTALPYINYMAFEFISHWNISLIHIHPERFLHCGFIHCTSANSTKVDIYFLWKVGFNRRFCITVASYTSTAITKSFANFEVLPVLAGGLSNCLVLS